VKENQRSFFSGIIIAILTGVSGNIAVTSAFEIAHINNLNKNSTLIGFSYYTALWAFLIGAIFLLIFTIYLALEMLEEC